MLSGDPGDFIATFQAADPPLAVNLPGTGALQADGLYAFDKEIEMNTVTEPGTPVIRTILLIMLGLFSACGGGNGGADMAAAVAGCDPSDAATAAECGTLLVGITDADGDFLSYTVDVVSLELEMENGRTVETLPAATRIDFAQYVELTEFVSASSVPPGTYVAGRITLDYSDAAIFVESDGTAKEAIVIDDAGNAPTRMTLDIRLDDRERLVITRGRPSLLHVDFDLAASHDVDFVPTPAIVTAAPFIIAEIDPVESKDIRVRGPVIDVDADSMTYTVAIRPFHDRNGDFGRVEVHVTDETEFEVNEIMFAGGAGLRALAAAGTGTPSVAQGSLNVAERLFTAAIVLAGRSVPGSDTDAVTGSVIARSGNELRVRGATVILDDTRAFFRDDVLVTVGPGTKVFKRGNDALLGIAAISVAQAVTVRGNVTANDADRTHIDATQGAVRLHLTHLGGTVNTVHPGQLEIDLRTINRRRAMVFDFAGTGQSPDLDADPDNYEVATGPLPPSQQATGKPVAVRGFPTAFGMAPPDFDGRTVVDYSDVRSALGVGWGGNGTSAPFLSIGVDGLVLDHHNPDIDQRHYIKQGPVLIDLTALDSGTRIVPRRGGRAVYVIKAGERLRQFIDFDDFVTALAESLNGATAARSLYARGQYDADDNVFITWKIGVYLLQP